MDMLLTKNSTFIIGSVSEILGYLMNAIFYVLNLIGIPNVGLAIIIFTIVIYLLMTPLTYKQQKFSKLSAKMNPELQAIQAKYKGKKDNDSMMAMNQETQNVYAKYGVSPTGSCLQLIIQMPILFALYRVIYSMPAYVSQIRNVYVAFVDKLALQTGSAEFVQGFSQAKMYAKQFTNELFTSGNVDYVRNTFIDVLNKASSAEWASIGEKYHNLADYVNPEIKNSTVYLLNQYNSFLGLNIANSPSYMVKEAISNHAYILVVAALIIPFLSAFTQWLNVKLMPQPAQASNSSDNPMASSMKTMNLMMPIMSAFFCYTLPAGMGLYWIAGAIIRSVQQILINKHIDKVDIDAEIKKNIEKNNKKRAKAGLAPQTLTSNAKISTKSAAPKSTVSKEEKEEAIRKATEYYNKSAKPGSIAAKANMVKQFNEKNNK